MTANIQGNHPKVEKAIRHYCIFLEICDNGIEIKSEGKRHDIRALLFSPLFYFISIKMQYKKKCKEISVVTYS